MSATLFRLIGVLPIVIFIARLIQYIQVGTPDWIAANCHVSNLMLGVGMILGLPLLIRVATIWLVIGVPMWIIDAIVTKELWWSSIYSHLGGFIIGLYAISKTRSTGRSWLPALLWFVFMQITTRFTTAPELNINVAHSPYELVKGWFSSYWTFWPICLLFVTTMVWIVEFCLSKIFPFHRRNFEERFDPSTEESRLIPEGSLLSE